MEIIVNYIENNTEAEEDDYGSYFLQPASSPYNITEKVQQANYDLFNSNALKMEKTTKVTFREELDSYEPELLTDDDVNSIESDQVIDNEQTINGLICELKTDQNVLNLNIFNINEDEETEPEVFEEILEIIEDISEDRLIDSLEEVNGLNDDGNLDNNNTVRVSSSILSENCTTKSKSGNRKRTRKKSDYVHVDCKTHCIERLDFDLSMSIKKLEIQEKPVNCPLLKLQSRKCCDENIMKNSLSLPCYNGHRSEYGLSSVDLERRARRKEIIKLKEQKREQLMREYQSRKNQQNEAVFCQWLKDVARRKTTAQKAQQQKLDSRGLSSGGRNKECFSPTIISFPTKATIEKHEASNRPKTANEFVPRHSIKKSKRPHTSSNKTTSCVFIQVPQKLLERGISIGDLMVTNGKYNAKKMHILSVS